MENFVILTDSSCDLTAELVTSLQLEVLPLSVEIGGKRYFNYPDNREIDPKVLYQMLRDGESAHTAAVNVGEFTAAMTPILQGGTDILILAFSSGLSNTCNAARLAAEDLASAYPERKIYVVDTLCASMGQGLLIYHAARLRQEGKTIEEVRDWCEGNKLKLAHWFTVNDLMFLKRGGRVSGTTALLGTMLSIKPVMHVDNEGKLVNVSKARGRKASIQAMAEKLLETAVDPQNQTIFITHGDCLEDAQTLAGLLEGKVREVVINYVGPVIGAHSGPGTLALFFLASGR